MVPKLIRTVCVVVKLDQFVVSSETFSGMGEDTSCVSSRPRVVSPFEGFCLQKVQDGHGIVQCIGVVGVIASKAEHHVRASSHVKLDEIKLSMATTLGCMTPGLLLHVYLIQRPILSNRTKVERQRTLTLRFTDHVQTCATA